MRTSLLREIAEVPNELLDPTRHAIILPSQTDGCHRQIRSCQNRPVLDSRPEHFNTSVLNGPEPAPLGKAGVYAPTMSDDLGVPEKNSRGSEVIFFSVV